MRTKNHIKANGAKDDSLRGIGKLGWTESGTTISTQRRLAATFVDDDTPIRKIKKRGNKKKCPLCKRNARVHKGKFIKHTWSWWGKALKMGDFYMCKNSNKEI